MEGTDKATGNTIIMVDNCRGTDSKSCFSETGTLALTVRGSTGIGKDNESRVASILRNRLQQDGLDVVISKGADERGEDFLMKVGGYSLIVQVIIAPADREFWHKATHSEVNQQRTIPQVVEWLRAAIEAKVNKIPIPVRASTILVVDVKHVGVLAMKHPREVYLKEYECPVAEFGFASVWIVGPTEKYCMRLGDGKP